MQAKQIAASPSESLGRLCPLGEEGAAILDRLLPVLDRDMRRAHSFERTEDFRKRHCRCDRSDGSDRRGTLVALVSLVAGANGVLSLLPIMRRMQSWGGLALQDVEIFAHRSAPGRKPDFRWPTPGILRFRPGDAADQQLPQRGPYPIYGLMTPEQIADGGSSHALTACVAQGAKDFVSDRIAEGIAEDVGGRGFAVFPNG